MAKKIKQEDDLFKFIQTTCEIECSFCEEVHIMSEIDEYSFLEEIYHYGWRATKKAAYCPSCRQKLLINL